MIGNWFSDVFGEQTLDAISNALIFAYGWAKEWQILLAGLLVLSAALIVARAIRKTSKAPAPKTPELSQAELDLRLAARPVGLQDHSGDLIGELEQPAVAVIRGQGNPCR